MVNGEKISREFVIACRDNAKVRELVARAIGNPELGAVSFATIWHDLPGFTGAGREQLLAFAASGVIPKFGIPEKIQFVDALAKTGVGPARRPHPRAPA